MLCDAGTGPQCPLARNRAAQAQLAKLKRMQFGRKSEKLDRKIEQLETRLEDLIAEDGASEQKAALPAAHLELRASRCRAHLSREDNIIEPPDGTSCSACRWHDSSH